MNSKIIQKINLNKDYLEDEYDLLDIPQEKKKKKYTKSNLPVKVCESCNRPYNWRKKWEKCWDEVKFCSDRCRNLAKNERKLKKQNL